MAASGSGRAAQLLALVGKELRHRTADRYPLAFPMRALSEEFESCEGGDDLTLLQTYHELLKSVREQSVRPPIPLSLSLLLSPFSLSLPSLPPVTTPPLFANPFPFFSLSRSLRSDYAPLFSSLALLPSHILLPSSTSAPACCLSPPSSLVRSHSHSLALSLPSPLRHSNPVYCQNFLHWPRNCTTPG
eukprot:TRINITY_DN1491_c0_g1_i2.p2 TRINITY_DN1491_c0_g1~~TRINITY_DN1491_c0_g1_i2.p2  ORF type:complete len:188 (-),score=31.28 TRINITY_DN1491_c0_g1_i2:315-878(-)